MNDKIANVLCFIICPGLIFLMGCMAFDAGRYHPYPAVCAAQQDVRIDNDHIKEQGT
jgi:hypothetical protein